MDDTANLIIAGTGKGKSLREIYGELGENTDKAVFYRAVLACVHNGQIPNVFICRCGHDCSRCLTFLATINADEALRQKSAGYYKTVFGMDIPAEKLRCFGGCSDEIMEVCRECPFISCCGEKGLNSCYECGSYPCGALADYTRKYVNKANQLKGKQNG